MLVPPESSSAVLVMIRSKSVSICNHSRAKLVSSRKCTFSMGYPNLMHTYGGLLKHRGSKLALLKSTFNAENFIRRLSRSILNGFGAIHSQKCVSQPRIAENSLKTPNFWGSWSSMLVPPESWSAVLVMISSMCLYATVFTLDEPIVVK